MIPVADYENAELDPVTINSKRVLDKLNSINSQYALILMCKDYGNFTATEVVAYWVDKYPSCKLFMCHYHYSSGCLFGA
jgi:hypothetical protein